MEKIVKLEMQKHITLWKDTQNYKANKVHFQTLNMSELPWAKSCLLMTGRNFFIMNASAILHSVSSVQRCNTLKSRIVRECSLQEIHSLMWANTCDFFAIDGTVCSAVLVIKCLFVYPIYETWAFSAQLYW